MSYSASYWRMFMLGEELPRDKFNNSCYPDGPIVYNRYTIAYMWRMIILYAAEQTGLIPSEAYDGLGEIDIWLHEISFLFKETNLFVRWQGYEDEEEHVAVRLLCSDIYDREDYCMRWRVEDLYGIGLDWFFERTSFSYIWRQATETMFKSFKWSSRKDVDLDEIYELGSGPRWNGRISFRVRREELWIAYQLKNKLMYSHLDDPKAVFKEIFDIAKGVRYGTWMKSYSFSGESGYWDCFLESLKPLFALKPSSESFTALMTFADNLFMGQVFGMDLWTSFDQGVKSVFFSGEGKWTEERKQKYLEEQKNALVRTENYLQQRRDFFDGA